MEGVDETEAKQNENKLNSWPHSKEQLQIENGEMGRHRERELLIEASSSADFQKMNIAPLVSIC